MVIGEIERGGQNNYWRDLGELSAKNVDDVKRETGIDLTGYKRVMDTAAIKHVIKKHGDPRRENARRQIAVDFEDFLKLPDLFGNYDQIIGSEKTKGGLLGVKYLRSNGVEWVYVEEVRKGRQKVAMKTLYKKPLKQEAE